MVKGYDCLRTKTLYGSILKHNIMTYEEWFQKCEDIKKRIRWITDHKGYVSNKRISEKEINSTRLFLRNSVKGDVIYQHVSYYGDNTVCWQIKDGFAIFRDDGECFLNPRSYVQYRWRDKDFTIVIPEENIFKGLRIYIIYNLVVFNDFNDLREYAKVVLKDMNLYNKLSSNYKKRFKL